MQIAVLAQCDFRVGLNVSSFFAEAFGVVSIAESQQVQVTMHGSASTSARIATTTDLRRMRVSCLRREQP